MVVGRIQVRLGGGGGGGIGHATGGPARGAPPGFFGRWAPGADLLERPVPAGVLLAYFEGGPRERISRAYPFLLASFWLYLSHSPSPCPTLRCVALRARTSLTLGTGTPCTLISRPGGAGVGGVVSRGAEACVSSLLAVLVVRVAGFLCSVLAWLAVRPCFCWLALAWLGGCHCANISCAVVADRRFVCTGPPWVPRLPRASPPRLWSRVRVGPP